MGAIKWIVGLLGWAAYGPIGALLGFWMGSAVDGFIERAKQVAGNGRDASEAGGNYRRQGEPGRSTYSATEQRNSFLVSLLVLSAAVIKADGKTLQSELDCVKEFVRKNFGDAAVPEAMRILDQLTRQQVNIYTVGPQIARYMNYSQRLQLFHYLVQIAQADGDFSSKEKSVLEAIGTTIGLSRQDVDSVIAMFYRDPESAYAVLGISPTATDDEVRSAYRRMAMKNHPDKVATLGHDVQKAAAEKFRQVHEAYEAIKRERGLK
ncbi:MAG: TerB family tellurite resistance protein [Bacteroidales bacterium]|nr:TerB family tellurite resistance protein [Bacteroidales bacterium]